MSQVRDNRIVVPQYYTPQDVYKMLQHEGKHELQYLKGHLDANWDSLIPVERGMHGRGIWKGPKLKKMKNWPTPEAVENRAPGELSREEYLQLPYEVEARESAQKGAKHLHAKGKAVLKAERAGRTGRFRGRRKPLFTEEEQRARKR